jgi:hypothetical protein
MEVLRRDRCGAADRPGLGLAEQSVRGGDANVAKLGKLASPASRVPVNGGDNRFVARPGPVEMDHGPFPWQARPPAHLLEVRAGGEGPASAAEDPHPQLVVVLEAVNGAYERLSQRLILGVENRRSVERDDQLRTANLNEHRGIIVDHIVLLIASPI